MNTVKNQDTGSYGGVPEVARQYKEAGVNWVLKPRFLGGRAIIVKSFSR